MYNIGANAAFDAHWHFPRWGRKRRSRVGLKTLPPKGARIILVQLFPNEPIAWTEVSPGRQTSLDQPLVGWWFFPKMAYLLLPIGLSQCDMEESGRRLQQYVEETSVRLGYPYVVKSRDFNPHEAWRAPNSSRLSAALLSFSQTHFFAPPTLLPLLESLSLSLSLSQKKKKK